MYLLLSWTVCRFNFIVVIIIIVFSMIISIAILSLSVFLMIILRGSDQIIVVFRFWGTRYIPVKDRRKSRIFCLDLTWSFYVLQITVSSQSVSLLFTLFCFILSSLIETLFPGMLWFLKAHFTSFLQVTITTYDIIRQLAKSILRECLNIVCLFVCLFIAYYDISPSSSDETIQNGLYPSKAGCNISAASASNWQYWSTASFKHDFAAVNSLWMKIWL